MKLTSPGRLGDPVIENATAAATSIAGGLRLRWRKFRNNGESYRAIKEVSKRVGACTAVGSCVLLAVCGEAPC